MSEILKKEREVVEILSELFRYQPVTVNNESTVSKSIIVEKKQKKRPKNDLGVVGKRLHQLICFPTRPPFVSYHVPNSDITYTYPKLMIDALSSCVPQRYINVMKKICAEDVELILEYEGEQNPFGPNHRYFSGVDNVVALYLAIMDSAPDALFKINDPIKTYRDASTNISFQTWSLTMRQTRTKILVDHINTSVRKKDNKTADTECNNKKQCIPSEVKSSISVFDPHHTDDTASISSNESIIHYQQTYSPVPSTSSSSSSSSKQHTNVSNDCTESYTTDLDTISCSTSDTTETVADNSATKQDSALDTLITDFSSRFSVTPLAKPQQIVHEGKYYLDINSDMQITRICNLFNVTFT